MQTSFDLKRIYFPQAVSVSNNFMKENIGNKRLT